MSDERSVEDHASIRGWALVGNARFRGRYDALDWQDGMVSIRCDCDVSHRFSVNFHEVGDFEVDFSTREIRSSDSTQRSPETFRHLLLDQVLPRIVAHEGNLVLHAAGVLVGDGAILFVGRSGAGKSTLAASFYTAGHVLLGDDAIVVTSAVGHVSARALYRSLRLFDDSIAHTLGDSARMAPVADYLAKWSVLGFDSHVSEEAPIRAVFFVDPVPSAAPSAHRVEGASACMSLVEQSFALDPTDAHRSQERLAIAVDLARQVPLFEIAYPRDYGCLQAVHGCIIEALDNAR